MIQKLQAACQTHFPKADFLEVVPPSITIENADIIDWPKVAPCLERIVRTCYKSEHLAKEGSYERLIKNVVHDKHHNSVMEHAVVISFRIVTSRGISLEAVRHRMTELYPSTTEMSYPALPRIGEDLKPSVSQESQRYVNYANRKYQIIFSSRLLSASPCEINYWYDGLLQGFVHYDHFVRKYGWQPQHARDFLPEATKTEFVLTFNLASLRNFFNLRLPNTAHPDMRLLAAEGLRLVAEKVGVVFNDFPLEDKA